MSEKKFDLLGTMDRLVGNTRTMAGLSGDPRVRDNLRDGEKARATVAELIEEHAAQRELLRIQEEAMTAYRELVEHRNRQIFALGGEP